MGLETAVLNGALLTRSAMRSTASGSDAHLLAEERAVSMAADRKWSEATRKQVVEMYLKGAKLEAINAATTVPISTIFHILKEAGVAPQRMTRRKLEPTSQTDQVSTLEWLTSRLFELQTENARLLDILAEYGISPLTGEVEDGTE